MKKRTRKLALHRETLSRLERLNLTKVVGGDCTCTCCTCYTYCGNCPYSWDGNCCPGETNEILSGCASNCG